MPALTCAAVCTHLSDQANVLQGSTSSGDADNGAQAIATMNASMAAAQPYPL